MQNSFTLSSWKHDFSHNTDPPQDFLNDFFFFASEWGNGHAPVNSLEMPPTFPSPPTSFPILPAPSKTFYFWNSLKTVQGSQTLWMCWLCARQMKKWKAKAYRQEMFIEKENKIKRQKWVGSTAHRTKN